MGSAEQTNSKNFKRRVYIKFDLDPAESLFTDFDEFITTLSLEDQPTEMMRNSIEMHPSPILISTDGMLLITACYNYNVMQTVELSL